MKALTPTDYANEVWGGTVTSKTIRNWIIAGRELKGVSRVEQTPTGHYVLFMEEAPVSKALSLVEQMKAKAKAA